MNFKICSDGKVINPKTGRCIKMKDVKQQHICADGKVINPKTGRCIKMKDVKQQRICTDGKVINPKTGRCIKMKDVKQKNDISLFNNTTFKMSVKNTNQAIVNNLKILSEYEIINKEPFKAKAYDKVIDSIELYENPIKTTEDLKNIKGIGTKIADKIVEFLQTGKMHTVEKAMQDEKYILGKKLLGIYGIGPSKIAELLETIKTFDDLYQNQSLLNDKQKIGLKYYEDLNSRIPITEGKKHYKIIEKHLAPQGITFEMVGSFRRKAKSMGDIDILIQENPEFNLKTFIAKLVASGYIIETLASGKNKFMGICKLSPDLPARRIDILVADKSYYYFALLYFTGSYNFNIYMRRKAIKKGLSLSEYGFKDINTKIMVDTSESIKSEEDIFQYIEIPYIPPNKR
jgi:DNA polymerase beta